jgi:hypothetical protein
MNSSSARSSSLALTLLNLGLVTIFVSVARADIQWKSMQGGVPDYVACNEQNGCCIFVGCFGDHPELRDCGQPPPHATNYKVTDWRPWGICDGASATITLCGKFYCAYTKAYWDSTCDTADPCEKWIWRDPACNPQNPGGG